MKRVELMLPLSMFLVDPDSVVVWASVLQTKRGCSMGSFVPSAIVISVEVVVAVVARSATVVTVSEVVKDELSAA